LLLSSALPRASAVELVIEPSPVTLSGNFARAQLVVRETPTGDPDLARDWTSQAQYTSTAPDIVQVDERGRLVARQNGKAIIRVVAQGLSREVAVEVSNIDAKTPINFDNEVLPILTKAGCNMGACHAVQHGQAGFKLSVFSFDPPADFDAILRDRSGRRVDLINPAHSLLLRKPTLEVPHGGGKRLAANSLDHQMLVAWLTQGAAGPKKDAPKVARIEVSPKRRVGEVGLSQQLRVTATYANGTQKDVTCWTQFDSMDEAVAKVSKDGLISAVGRGQAAVMVRFGGQAEIAMLVVPFTESIPLEDWKDQNFIDTLAAKKFRELGLEPSPRCDDATFLRRAFLDAIGTLPTPEEAEAFLKSTDPNKRENLVDRLLGLTGDPAQDLYGNAWSAYWALKWSDLIRSSSANLGGDQGMWSLYNWIRGAVRSNMPIDQFVREMILAQGSVYMSGPANYYRIARQPDELAETTAQVFLGIRIQCAKCHHHPFESYGQEDYYGLAAFFARITNKPSQEFGLFGGEQIVMVRPTGDVRHPRTNQIMPPTPLGGQPVDDPLDRRRPLAQWLTSHDNAFFSRNIVNRYVSYLMGRGLVEPVDDLRQTNPASNPELMDALCKYFVDHKCDIKQLVKVIMNSRLYQLSSQPTEANHTDTRFFSYYQVRRIAAEPLLDAIDQAAGTNTKFPNLPIGTRAIELPDSEYKEYFLVAFGKPRRMITCECERVPDPNLAQSLHVLNGDTVSSKVASPQGRIAKLISAKKSSAEIVTQLYLATLSRPPRDEELATAQRLLALSPNNPREIYEDLMWALMNSKEFLFVH